MNPNLRRILVAGLGSISVTEKAVKNLVDDLVKKGDVTRQEGEKLLAEAEKKVAGAGKKLSGAGKKLTSGSGDFEKAVEDALHKALDRVGLARKSEVIALEHRLQRIEGGRARSRATTQRAAVAPRRKRPSAGTFPEPEPPKE